MRIVEFVYGIIEKFAPMEPQSKVALKTDAQAWLNDADNELQNINHLTDQVLVLETKAADSSNALTDDDRLKLMEEAEIVKGKIPKLTLKHKFVKWSDNWMFRTFLAVGFIWVVPKIQEYLNPSKPQYQEIEDEF